MKNIINFSDDSYGYEKIKMPTAFNFENNSGIKKGENKPILSNIDDNETINMYNGFYSRDTEKPTNSVYIKPNIDPIFGITPTTVNTNANTQIFEKNIIPFGNSQKQISSLLENQNNEINSNDNNNGLQMKIGDNNDYTEKIIEVQKSKSLSTPQFEEIRF